MKIRTWIPHSIKKREIRSSYDSIWAEFRASGIDFRLGTRIGSRLRDHSFDLALGQHLDTFSFFFSEHRIRDFFAWLRSEGQIE